MASLFFPSSDLTKSYIGSRPSSPLSPAGSHYVTQGLLALTDDLLPPVPPPLFPIGKSATAENLENYRDKVIKLQEDMHERLTQLVTVQLNPGAYGVDELILYRDLYENALRVTEIASACFSGMYLTTDREHAVSKALEDLERIEKDVDQPWHRPIQSIRRAICEQLGIADVPKEQPATSSDKPKEEETATSYVMVEAPQPKGTSTSLRSSYMASQTPRGREFLEAQCFKLRIDRNQRQWADQNPRPISQNFRTVAELGHEASALYNKGDFRGVCEKLKHLSTHCGADSAKQLPWVCYELGWSLHLLGRSYFKLAMEEKCLTKLELATNILWEALNLKDTRGVSVIADFEVATLTRLVCAHLLRAEIGGAPQVDRDVALDLLCLCTDHFHVGVLKETPKIAEGAFIFDPIAYVVGFLKQLRGKAYSAKETTGLILAAGQRCSQMAHVWKIRAIERTYEAAGGREVYYAKMKEGQPIPKGTEDQVNRRKALKANSRNMHSASFAFFVNHWACTRPLEPYPEAKLDQYGLPEDFHVEVNMAIALLNLGRHKRSDISDKGFAFDTLVRRAQNYAPNLALLLMFLEAAHCSQYERNQFVHHTFDLFHVVTRLPKSEKVTKEHVRSNRARMVEFSEMIRLKSEGAWALVNYNFVYTINRHFGIA